MGATTTVLLVAALVALPVFVFIAMNNDSKIREARAMSELRGQAYQPRKCDWWVADDNSIHIMLQQPTGTGRVWRCTYSIDGKAFEGVIGLDTLLSGFTYQGCLDAETLAGTGDSRVVG